MNRSDEPFLSRWSRLKQEGARKSEDGPAADRARDHGEDRAEEASRPAGMDGAGKAGHDASRAAAPQDADAVAELKSIDVEALDFSSDFTRFMQNGVPDQLRNKALRKLWTSHPIFAHIDGLDDYCEDFSDAVWATPDLKTAYKIGRGFLNDDEVSAWESLDKPQDLDAPAGYAATAAAVPADRKDKGQNTAEAEGQAGQPDTELAATVVPNPNPASPLPKDENREDAPNGAAGACVPAGRV